MLDPTKKDTPSPRAKEKLQQDGRRREITIRIKPVNHQRHSEGSNLVYQDPETPESKLELCLNVSCKGTVQQWAAAWSGALGAADLGMASALLEEVAINPTIEPLEFT